MLFVNRGKDTQVRIEEKNGYLWVLLKTGKEIDIPEQQGINYGFEKVITTQGKIGNTIVETKQIEYTSDGIFLNELIAIKGIGKKTANDIVEWGTKEKLIEYISGNKKLPFRDDVELKLREKYGKRT